MARSNERDPHHDVTLPLDEQTEASLAPWPRKTGVVELMRLSLAKRQLGTKQDTSDIIAVQFNNTD